MSDGWRSDELATDARGWAVDLAIFRVVLLGGIVLPFAWSTWRWTADAMPALPRDVWAPVSFYALLPLDVLTSARLAWWLLLADLVLIGLALAGVRTRLTLGAATLVSLYAFGLRLNLGKIDHFHHLVWFMALTAAGPSAHVLSVDAIVAAIRGRSEPAAPSGALATLRCIWLLMGVLYLSAGLPKLAAAVTGGWASADNLRLIAWSQWFHRGLYQPGFEPSRWVDALPDWLLSAGGFGVIAFEVGFVAVVLRRSLRPLLAVVGVLFHVANGVVLGIWFGFLVPAYAALIDWVALGRRLVPTRVTVQYDARCLGCRRTLAVLRTFDLLDTVRLDARDPGPRCHAGAHAIVASDGVRREQGIDAVRLIARHLPLLWPFSVATSLLPRAAVRRWLDRRGSQTRRDEPASRTGMIVALGVALIAGQTIVSAVRVFAPGWPVPRWPFDAYPNFTEPRPREVTVWEARVALEDGRELVLGPRAWARAFGSPARCKRVAEALLLERDPDRRRERTRETLALLWRYEAADVRGATKSLVAYATRYAVGPVPTRLTDTLVGRLTVEEIAALGAGRSTPARSGPP